MKCGEHKCGMCNLSCGKMWDDHYEITVDCPACDGTGICKGGEVFYDDGDWACPECDSEEVHEIAYPDDFGSMKCDACGYCGDPGEDFNWCNFPPRLTRPPS